MGRGVLGALALLLTLPVRATADELTLQQFAAEVLPSVVKITASGRDRSDQPHTRQGTGLLVHPQGWILTAAHNVGRDDEWLADPTSKPIRTIKVHFMDAWGIEVELPFLKIETRDFDHDAALLRVSATNLHFQWLRNPGHASVGDKVYAMGWGEGRARPEPIDGTIVDISDPSNKGLLKLRLDGRHGDSGGPVMDVHGHFVGVIVEGRTDLPQAVYVSPSLPAHPTRALLPEGPVPLRLETDSAALLREEAQVELQPLPAGAPVQLPFHREVALLPDRYLAIPALGRPTSIPSRTVSVENAASTQSILLSYSVDLFGFLKDESARGLKGMRIQIGQQISAPTLHDGSFVLRGLPLDDLYQYVAFSDDDFADYTANDPFEGSFFNVEWEPAFSRTLTIPPRQ